jgi:hypothetical protein
MPGTTTINGTIKSGITLTTPDTMITKTGKVTSSHTAVTGSSSSSLTVDNAGIIAGLRVGVHIQGAPAQVINSGSIDGYGYGAFDGGVVLTSGGSVTNASAGAAIAGTKYGVYISNGAGTVANAGSIRATHGNAVVLTDGGTVSNASTGVLYGDHTAVDIKGGTGTVINDGVIKGKTGYGVDLESGGTIVNAGTLSGAGYAAKFASGYDNRLVLDPGAVVYGVVDGGNKLGSAHESTLELASGASTGVLSGIYANFEQMVVDAGAQWDVTGTHTVSAGYTLTNNGTLYDGGALTNAGNVIGTGELVVLAGETFVDKGIIGSGQTIDFASHNGEIDLNVSGFSGVVGQFQTGDRISLTDVDNIVSYDVINGNTLDLVRRDHSHIDLTFNQDYTKADFKVTTSHDDTVITRVTCFAGGTRLDTQDGQIAVEDLQIGDNVLTASGQLRPVRWIGRRHLDLTRHPEVKQVLPIRIRAGALGAGLPRRDLLVSPDHAMLLDGLLIPARLLLNGASIRREERWRSVTYYHVELDSHDVLLAEGAEAESYLDTGNRNTFENAEGPMVLHPDLNDGQRRREAESCAPFAADAARVEPIWQGLMQRAKMLGFAMAEPREITSDPELRVEIAGTSFAPVAVEGRRHIFMLPKIQGALTLQSRHAVPSDDRPWIDDQRQLGVKVQRMILSSTAGIRTIPIDHPDLCNGWWDTEHDGNAMMRWTNGAAAIAITSSTPCRFEVEVGGTMDYQVAEELQEVLTLCA